MLVTELPLDQVDIGTEIRAKDHSWWKLKLKHSDGKVTLENGTREFTGRIKSPVVCRVSDDELREALKILGAVPYAVKIGAPPYIVQEKWRGPDELRSHIRFLHGYYVEDVKTRKELVECHATLHEDEDRPFYLTHVHDQARFAAILRQGA